MKKVKYMGLITMLLSICILIWFTGCGTTSRSFQGETQIGEAADIDELLGLADQKDQKKDKKESNETIAEDDVLKLLGVVEEDKPKVDEPSKLENIKSLPDSLEPPKENELKIQPINKTLPEWRATSFSDRYDEAYQDYRNRNYREAIQKFEALLSMNSNHSLSDNCQYWIGESYYGMENYRQAIIAFEKVFSFPKSNKDEDSQLKLGLCYLRLDDKERAKIEMQKFIDSYPSSEHVSIAKRWIEAFDKK